ncbi:MAG: hypothetical protein OQK49_01495 [Proteobacteria bacterium]|nr:hypothetical protein [Pseudomonadota bacterium]
MNPKLTVCSFILLAPVCHALADCQPWDARTMGNQKRIIRIDIDNQNVFDNELKAENKTFHKLANRLHIKTKRHIILRELLFRVGDSFHWRVLEETERNLRSKPYIKDAQVYPSLQCEDGVVIQVTTQDDWTLEPGLGFGASGGKSKFSAELQEKNLLGLGKGLELKYKKGFVRNETSLRYEDPNLFGSKKRLNLRYQNNSDGDLKELHLENPFYALTTKRAWEIDLSDGTLINPIYRRGQIVDEIGQNHQQLTVNSAWLIKNNAKKYHRFRVGLTSDNSRFFNSEDYLQSELPDDRDYNYPWIGYEFIQEDYIERTNFNGMGRTEDIALGHHLSGKLGQDFSLASTFFSLNYQKGYTPNRRHLMTLNTYLSGIHNSDGFVNTHVGIKTEWYYFQSPSKTLYVSTLLDQGTHLYPEQPQYLGGETGLRGYPFRYLTGDNIWLTTLEQRFFYDWYPLHSFQFASAVFMDTGSAWSSGQSKEIFTDVGIGFRLVSTRSAGGKVIHFDLAFPTSSSSDLDSVQFQITAKNSF